MKRRRSYRSAIAMRIAELVRMRAARVARKDIVEIDIEIAFWAARA